jgi:hypothetical protein
MVEAMEVKKNGVDVTFGGMTSLLNFMKPWGTGVRNS